MAKRIDVLVTTLAGDLERFAIPLHTSSKQLFDQVVKTIGLRETWYFGLQYTDNKGYNAWLDMDKKVLSQDIKNESPLQFQFRVKLFPENASKEIIEDITSRLFYLQVKDAILSGEIYCPPETSILLASYALQAKYGAYSSEMHKPGNLANERLSPERVHSQLSPQELEQNIITWWQKHSEMMRQDAMKGYLQNAQDLKMYGVSYFEIKNKEGMDVWLGIGALGVNIYGKNDRLTPIVSLAWTDAMPNISSNKEKLVIKSTDKKVPDFVFMTPHVRIVKRILAICMDKHSLYLRRRKPDTIQVQQLKAQVEEKRQRPQGKNQLAGLQSREQLMEAQESIRRLEQQLLESKMKEFDSQLKIYELQFQLRQVQTEASRRRLEHKLREHHVDMEELSVCRIKLNDMEKRYKEDQGMQASEREKLAEDIHRYKEKEVLLLNQVAEKDLDIRGLQADVEEAQSQQEMAQKALYHASLDGTRHNFMHNVQDQQQQRSEENADREQKIRPGDTERQLKQPITQRKSSRAHSHAGTSSNERDEDASAAAASEKKDSQLVQGNFGENGRQMKNAEREIHVHWI